MCKSFRNILYLKCQFYILNVITLAIKFSEQNIIVSAVKAFPPLNINSDILKYIRSSLKCPFLCSHALFSLLLD